MIVPGISFGPVALGETLDDLRRGGLVPGDVSATHAEITSTGLQVSLCEGKIIDVWLDDLRVGPDCVRYEGASIARSIRREALEQRFGDCTATPPGIGAAYERCADGGRYVGHGLDDSLQLRVTPKGFAFDDTCAIATDDGTSVELSPSARSSLLRQTLNLSELDAASARSSIAPTSPRIRAASPGSAERRASTDPPKFCLQTPAPVRGLSVLDIPTTRRRAPGTTQVRTRGVTRRSGRASAAAGYHVG